MRMKILEQTANDAEEEHIWNDVVVLHINHCLDNSFFFNDVLKRLFFEVIFVAVPYNNQKVDSNYPNSCYHGLCEDATYQLMKNGKNLGICHPDFLEATFMLMQEAFCREIIPLLQSGKKLLVIEDGGYHFEVLSRLRALYPDIEKNTIGVVEQTTSGTRNSMSKTGYRYPYPCASIARSNIKMELESIFIGQRIVEELALMLYEADAFLSFHSVLLVGYGIVGRSCRMALEGRFCQLSAYDTNEDIRQLAGEEGLQVYDAPCEEMFFHDTVVVGCVGRPSFGMEMFRCFLQGKAERIYLASGSSKNVEFKEILEYLAGNRPAIEGLSLICVEQKPLYTKYSFEYKGTTKELFLLAEGKPVNFYREGVISLTYRVIDLVFAEMLHLALYLCNHRDLPPQLYILGDDNAITKDISEQDLLELWFRENRFYSKGNTRAFLNPHPMEESLRKIAWENEYGNDN